MNVESRGPRVEGGGLGSGGLRIEGEGGGLMSAFSRKMKSRSQFCDTEKQKGPTVELNGLVKTILTQRY